MSDSKKRVFDIGDTVSINPNSELIMRISKLFPKKKSVRCTFWDNENYCFRQYIFEEKHLIHKRKRK
jgi:hypothetical protein